MLLRRTIGMPDGLFEMQQGLLNIYVCYVFSKWEVTCNNESLGGLWSKKAVFTLAQGSLSFAPSLRR